MYSIFRNNSALGYVLTLAFLVLMRLRTLVEPERYIAGDQPELYTGLWTPIFGGVVMGTLMASILALVVTAVCTTMINVTANRFRFTQPSSLTGLCFAALSGGLLPSLCFHPVLIFTIFYISSCNRLFASLQHDRPYASCFWSMALLCIGSLFWAKGFWFVPFMLIMMFVMRIAEPRSLVAALLGLLAPLLLATCYILFQENPVGIFEDYAKCLFSTVALWRTGVYSWIYMALVMLLTAIATLYLQGNLLKLGIVESRRARIVIWLTTFPVFLMILPTFSYEAQILVAVGAALSVPKFIMSINNANLREILLDGLLIATAFYIWK